MKARITFRTEIVIEGEDLQEIMDKWNNITLYSEDAHKNGIEFIEVTSMENEETGEGLLNF